MKLEELKEKKDQKFLSKAFTELEARIKKIIDEEGYVEMLRDEGMHAVDLHALQNYPDEAREIVDMLGKMK